MRTGNRRENGGAIMRRQIDTLHQEIAEEQLEQLFRAGYPADTIDNGWAFDRAVAALDAQVAVDLWTSEDFDRCAIFFKAAISGMEAQCEVRKWTDEDFKKHEAFLEAAAKRKVE